MNELKEFKLVRVEATVMSQTYKSLQHNQCNTGLFIWEVIDWLAVQMHTKDAVMIAQYNRGNTGNPPYSSYYLTGSALCCCSFDARGNLPKNELKRIGSRYRRMKNNSSPSERKTAKEGNRYMT